MHVPPINQKILKALFPKYILILSTSLHLCHSCIPWSLTYNNLLTDLSAFIFSPIQILGAIVIIFKHKLVYIIFQDSSVASYSTGNETHTLHDFSPCLPLRFIFCPLIWSLGSDYPIHNPNLDCPVSRSAGPQHLVLFHPSPSTYLYLKFSYLLVYMFMRNRSCYICLNSN